MIEITSVNNELVKEVVKLQQKKYRDETKKFLLEGFKPIQEAFLAGIEIEQVFVLKEKAEKYAFLQKTMKPANDVALNLIQGRTSERPCDPESSSGRREGSVLNSKLEFILTTEPVLKKISTTDSAPDAVAVARQKFFTIDDIKSAKKITLLENIKDLGNLGTILRTAKAFSQDAVILFGDTVDLYNPKCVRSAVGNLWKIPVVNIKDFQTLETEFEGFERIATLPKSNDSKFLKDFKINAPYLIMFGAEAEGLSGDLIDFATKKVTIEMDSTVESLNLSVSVGVVLYKIAMT